MLDQIAPDHPVAIKDVSQHNLWVNARALALTGITAHTPNPPGGEIERDANGQPTGILIESAGAAVQRFLDPTEAQLDAAVAHLSQYFIALVSPASKSRWPSPPNLPPMPGDRAGKLNLHVGAHLTRFSPFSEDWVPLETLTACAWHIKARTCIPRSRNSSSMACRLRARPPSSPPTPAKPARMTPRAMLLVNPTG